MIVRFERKSLVLASVMAGLMLAGCNSRSTPFDHGDRSPGILKPPSATQTAANAGAAPVVAGNCPQVSLREGTAFLRKYMGGKGAKDDPAKLIYQASLADTTRQCAMNNGAMTITVMAQGRLVTGPAGKSGNYALPIRVVVQDGEQTVYTQLVKFNAEVPAGQPSAQFLFSKNDIVLNSGVSPTSAIFLGFDEGPYNTK